MKWSKIIAGCAAAFLFLLPAGCGQAASPLAGEAETKQIALIMSQEDEFLNDLKNAIQTEMKQQGYEALYYCSDGDNGTQISQVHAARAAGVETLIVNLTSDGLAADVVQAAGGANIVFVNRMPDDRAVFSENVVFVGPDEALCGQMQGEALADYFIGQSDLGEVRYLMFQGVAGLENTRLRSENVLSTLETRGIPMVAAAEFQVCDFYRDQARDAMAALLEQQVPFDCVISNNDAMAMGVIEAMKDAGMNPGSVPIVGVDLTEDAKNAVKSGALYMTVRQALEEEANAAVTAAVNLNSGRAFHETIDLPIDDTDPFLPYIIRTPVVPVSAETAV